VASSRKVREVRQRRARVGMDAWEKISRKSSGGKAGSRKVCWRRWLRSFGVVIDVSVVSTDMKSEGRSLSWTKKRSSPFKHFS
jgi:hypothetical protein